MTAAVLAAILGLAGCDDPTFPPPKTLGPVESYGRGVARTMAKLASATPDHHPRVEILFYGQSITEQDWWKAVAADLTRRYPHAELVITNEAIGGHSSQRLVKAIDADLFSNPDLIIFHVYGSHVDYETIVRKIRARTTAELILQTDHLARDDDPNESTDPEGLEPRGDVWNRFMNVKFLPEMAAKYGAELVDVRSAWKQYLRDYALTPADLLVDAIHLNDRGNFLMAEIVKSHLRETPGTTDNPAAGAIETLRIGEDLKIENDRLTLDVEAAHIDAILSRKGDEPATVLVDGMPPSQLPESYHHTPPSPYPGSNWPCLLRVGTQALNVQEHWTLTLTELSPDGKAGRFRVEGSVTGPDGEGTLAARFVSNSGRVVIEPDAWNLAYAIEVFGPRIQLPFEIVWSTIQLGSDRFYPALPLDDSYPEERGLAYRLPPGRHRLELHGPGVRRLQAIRLFRPALWGRAVPRSYGED